MKQKMITIIGPTASGKTDLAAHLAASFIVESKPAEIISGDSRQVYKGMDIGTGKDICDYTVSVPSLSEPLKVPYHLIDICAPGEKYNIFQYQQDFLRVYEDIEKFRLQISRPAFKNSSNSSCKSESNLFHILFKLLILCTSS